MRPRILLLAADIDLRARIARELQSSGFAVELASDDERALKLAAEGSFLTAIVALGAGAAILPTVRSLSDAAQHLLVLAERADEFALLQRSLPGVEVLFLDRSNEEAAGKRIGEIVKLAGRGGDTAPSVGKILRVSLVSQPVASVRT